MECLHQYFQNTFEAFPHFYGIHSKDMFRKAIFDCLCETTNNHRCWYFEKMIRNMDHYTVSLPTRNGIWMMPDNRKIKFDLETMCWGGFKKKFKLVYYNWVYRIARVALDYSNKFYFHEVEIGEDIYKKIQASVKDFRLKTLLNMGGHFIKGECSRTELNNKINILTGPSFLLGGDRTVDAVIDFLPWETNAIHSYEGKKYICVSNSYFRYSNAKKAQEQINKQIRAVSRKLQATIRSDFEQMSMDPERFHRIINELKVSWKPSNFDFDTTAYFFINGFIDLRTSWATELSNEVMEILDKMGEAWFRLINAHGDLDYFNMKNEEAINMLIMDYDPNKRLPPDMEEIFKKLTELQTKLKEEEDILRDLQCQSNIEKITYIYKLVDLLTHHFPG